MKYIKPLDGLRAIAIALVLIFHLDDSYLKGGFIGVDMFFVISGFIITLNLLHIPNKNKHTLFLFYKTRVARLLPSVLATVLISILAASFVYGEEALSEYFTTATYAVLSLANFYFVAHSGYFEDGSQTNIFLHMWSLSVEEQFYLFWPLLIFAIAGLRKWSRATLAVILIVSMASSWLLSGHYSDMTFYLMPTRIFQFAAGGYLAHIFFVQRRSFCFSGTNNWLSDIVFILGLITVLLAATMSDGVDYDFLQAAVMPTLGACLLIGGINSRISALTVGHRLTCFVGQRAYSLYLVHWPIIVMLGVFIGTKRTLWMNIGTSILCFIFAEALHRLVERPLRLSKDVDATKSNTAKLKLILVITVGTVGITLYGNVQPNLLPSIPAVSPNSALRVPDNLEPDRKSNTTVSYTEIAASSWAKRTELGRARKCQLQLKKPYSDFDEAYCVKATERKKLMIIGDSFMAETLIMLKQVFDDESLLGAGTSGYLPIYRGEAANINSGSEILNQRQFYWVDREDISAIVLVSNWQYWSPQQFRSTIEYLISRKKPLIVVGIRPKYTMPIPTLLDSTSGKSAIYDLNTYLAFDLEKKESMIMEVVDEHASAIIYIDMLNYMCPNGACPAVLDDGKLIYLDSAHITADAAIEFGKSLDADLGGKLRNFANTEYIR